MSEVETEEIPIENAESSTEEIKSEADVEIKTQPETKKEGLKNGELLIFTVVITIQLFT